MSSHIKLSPKYGVNPSVGKCIFCEGDHEVVLFGLLNRRRAREMWGKALADGLTGDDFDLEAPRNVILSLDPCKDCEVFYPNAEKGVFFMLCDKESRPTGEMVCVREEAVKSILEGESLEDALRARRVLLDREAWDTLGFDRALGKTEEVSA